MSSYYFDAHQAGPERRNRITAQIRGKRLEFWTASGVFSREGLDKATSVLLENVELPPAGTQVLDLGCGWGAIACTLASSGAETWATDINERARNLTTQNAKEHGLRVKVLSPEDFPAEIHFDEIWSNPPIRIGKKALHELLLTWLPRLNTQGRALLVISKNLGSDSLQKWLIEQGWPTERLMSVKGFRVLEVRPQT